MPISPGYAKLIKAAIRSEYAKGTSARDALEIAKKMWLRQAAAEQAQPPVEARDRAGSQTENENEEAGDPAPPPRAA